MQTKSPLSRRDVDRARTRACQLGSKSESHRVNIRDRMQNCVAQDRLEELEQTAAGPSVITGITSDSIRDSILEQRLLLLNAVSEDTELIRASLDLCKKISRCLGTEERSLDLTH